jgi:hypothetical protein
MLLQLLNLPGHAIGALRFAFAATNHIAYCCCCCAAADDAAVIEVTVASGTGAGAGGVVGTECRLTHSMEWQRRGIWIFRCGIVMPTLVVRRHHALLACLCARWWSDDDAAAFVLRSPVGRSQRVCVARARLCLLQCASVCCVF